MPVVVADNSTIAEQIRCRRPRNQPISESDLKPPQIPSIIQSVRCKSTISSLLLSTFAAPAGENTATTAAATPKKKNFASGTLRGLGCAASAQVSVPAAIRTSANWETKKARKKKQRNQQQRKNKSPRQAAAMANANPSTASASSVVPDICCGPGIGFATEAAPVDCVVSRRVVSGRPEVEGGKMNHRERPSTRRAVNPEPISSMDPDRSFGMTNSGLGVFGARYHRYVRYPSPEGLAEIMMIQSNLLMGGRSDRFDRYRDWRLDVDNMSYEELLELGDRIGYVNTGLNEDEIVHCLRKTKLLDNLFSQFPTEIEWKCSICQEEYDEDDETGKLECGHFYHSHCIRQWLARKNTCPICKTTAGCQ